MKYIRGCKVVVLSAIFLLIVIIAVNWRYRIKTNKAEYNFYEELHRAEVANYFYNAHNVDIGSEEIKWSQAYGTEVPNRVLSNKIKESITYDDSMRKLAKEYGVDMPNTHEELVAMFKEYNENRLSKISQGEVVYGPEQYTLQNYYRYLYGNCETQIIEAIMEDVKLNQMDELQVYSERMDSSTKIENFIANLVTYTVEAEEYEERPNEVKDAYKAISERLNGSKVYLVQEEVDNISDILVFVSEIILDSKNVSGEDLYTAELIGEVRKLKPGDYFYAPIYPESEYEKMFYISDLKTDSSTSFFDDINSIASQYAIEQYEERLGNLIKGNKIKTPIKRER